MLGNVSLPNLKGNFHAHLDTSDDEIVLKLYINSNTISRTQFFHEVNQIPLIEFGNAIEVIQIHDEERLLGIDFQGAKTNLIQSFGKHLDSEGQFLLIYFDKVTLDWAPEPDKINTAEVFLNPESLGFVSSFYSPLYVDGDKLILNRDDDEYFNYLNLKFKPDYWLNTHDDLSKEDITIQKRPMLSFIDNFGDEQSFFKMIEGLCIGISFFYQSTISWKGARVFLPDKSVVIKKILPRFTEEKSNSLRHLGNSWRIRDFLLSDWMLQMHEKYRLLSKVIKKYIQAIQTEQETSFLLFYNILEIHSKPHGSEKDKFNPNEDSKRMIIQETFLDDYLKCLPINEHEDFKKKWSSIILDLKFKPTQSPLKAFFRENKIDIDKLPVPWKKIVELRNKLIHSDGQSIDEMDLRRANIVLYRLSGIAILIELGITEWRLNYEIKL